jgi:hypothetical protein
MLVPHVVYVARGQYDPKDMIHITFVHYLNFEYRSFVVSDVMIIKALVAFFYIKMQ